MAEANGSELTGVVATLEPRKYTPAGVPRQRFWLEHRSRQEEAGSPREVTLRIAVLLVGEDSVRAADGLKEGQAVKVRGFLSRAGYKGDARDRIQLHAQSLERL
jgi:primosomal replication protein N